MSLLLAVLSGFALAIAAPWIAQWRPRKAGWMLAILPAFLFAYFVSLSPFVIAGEAIRVSYPWVPSLDITLSFFVDGWSLLFALLILGIGALVLIYAGGYLAGHPRLGRFFAYFLLFMASMLGVVLADNVVALFVFWELTSVSSYLLIGFERERERARWAALQALLVTGLGGLALLAGLLLLGQMGGSLELSVLSDPALRDAIRTHELYLPALILILVGAFAKSAQFPFHFWLPNAMEAPTPVSAYLHSATMVKAGIYLLARLHPLLGGTEAWQGIITPVGAVTMLLGAFLALAQTDLKRILAYSTISSLGILTMLLGMGSEAAMLGAVVFLVAHALYKGALFLVSGAIDHGTGSRDVRDLGGLRRAMPITAAAAVLAACSMAGLFPFWGFLGKELLYTAVLGQPLVAALFATVLSGTAFVAIAGVVTARPFFGSSQATPKTPHEVPLSLWLGPIVLAAADFSLGVFHGGSLLSLLSSAAQSIAIPSTASWNPSLWEPAPTALLYSGIGWTVGAALVWQADGVRTAIAQAAAAPRLGLDDLYEVLLAALNGVARFQTRLLQSGTLRYYVLIIVATATVLGGYGLLFRGGFSYPVMDTTVQFHEGAVGLLILVAAVIAARSRSRLTAITSLGVVGYGVALIYVLFGAPDLAMTQFLVETLTVVLLLLVFYHLPRLTRLSTRAGRLRDLAAALLVGAVITGLVLAANAEPRLSALTVYFTEHSLPGGHGRNIVNVILVDFRALDTLGEITVLGVAGVGIYSLLKLRLGGKNNP